MTQSKARKLEVVNAYDGNFLIPLGDACIGTSLKCLGQFETNDIKRVANYLDSVQSSPSNKNLFIDIGANIGTHSISALKDHGYGRVIALEPSESNYRLLTANICLNGLLERATCINAAASDHDGTNTLFQNLTNCGDYRLGNSPHGSKAGASTVTEQISTVNIANHLSSHIGNIHLCDALCWIDTQGHEIPILRTLKPLLERGLPVVFEFWPFGMEQQGGNFAELESALSISNLQIAHLSNDAIKLISIDDLKQLWNHLRSSDDGTPEGASFSNIITYKSSAKETIGEYESRRIAMTLRCKDCSPIPKCERAGEVFKLKDSSYQLMHNGLKVVSGGYYGEWMRELIQKLRGHHEPQEEKVFHDINGRASSSGLIIELGCFWAYYSLWFLKDHPNRKAIGLEPDPVHINTAQANALLNDLASQLLCVNGLSSAASSASVQLTTESGATLNLRGYTVMDLLHTAKEEQIEILHCDAQGAESHVVDQAIELGKSNRLRFCIISTHAYEITGNPLTHQICLDKLRAAGAHIIAEHDVHESFSGDGLIAASFSQTDQDFQVEISCNRYSQSLFQNPAVHFSNALTELDSLREEYQEKDRANSKSPGIGKKFIQRIQKIWPT